jgi:phosphoglucosamine mutase
MTAGAFAAGLQAGGVAVEDAGVIPTPAVALLVRRLRFDLGASISASHNPARDNGVKLLGPDGEKAPDSFERAIEAGLAAARRARTGSDDSPAPGRLREGAAGEYVEALLEEFRGLRLKGLRVVVDGAEGAAGAVAPELLRRLGAEVHAIRCSGDGPHINDRCGALHPAPAGRAVRRRRAHLGMALDGDGDRLTLLDEKGAPRDGDDFLAALAPRLRERGRLPGGAVVGTVMSNGGLDAHLARHGIALLRVPVGDRHVARALRGNGLALGAEPSGHVLAPRPGGLLTADGLVAAVWVMREMARTKSPLSALLRGFERAPRAEAAIEVARKTPIERVPALRAAIGAAEEAAGPGGRVLVRYSGTEPKIRILVESPSRTAADRACAAIAAAAKKSLG